MTWRAMSARPYSLEDGRILRSQSTDGGLTWTPVEATKLKTPNSGFDTAKLSDGRVVLVHNFKTLGTLRVVVSIDDGQSWESVHLIEDGRGTAVGGKTKEGLMGQGGTEHASPAVGPGRCCPPRYVIATHCKPSSLELNGIG